MSTPQPIRRVLAADVVVDREERTIVSTINTPSVDRYMTVILPEGAALDNYRRNPVVLYNHCGSGPDDFPIGKNLWIKVVKNRIVAKTKFLPEGKLERADKVFDLYDLGFLNAWSVSLLPLEYGRPTPEEVKKTPDWAEASLIYRQWELLEYSCVTVPGNPEACREARSRGLALEGWPEDEPAPPPATAPDAARDLPSLVGLSRSLEQVLESVVRQLRPEAEEFRRRATRDALEVARGMA